MSKKHSKQPAQQQTQQTQQHFNEKLQEKTVEKNKTEKPVAAASAAAAGQTSPWISLFAETVLYYFFWSIFISHIPAVWFLPMSILRATDYGEEFYYLIAYTSPLLLFISPFKKFILHYPRIAAALPLIGLLSAVMPTLIYRTLLLCFGTLLGIPIYWIRFWVFEYRERTVYAFLLALLAFTGSRFAFSSIVPIWWNPFTAVAGFVVGLISCFFIGHEKVNFDGNYKESLQATNLTNMRYGLGFGLLIFLSHWILSAHGVIARWIDVDPFPAGIGIIVCIVLGILLSQFQITRSWIWWSIGVICSILLLSPFIPKNIAIYFGFVCVIYVTSLWYSLIVDLSTYSTPTGALFTAGIFYLIGNLAIIWSVAYCFVPKGTGGYYMRERAGQLFCLAVTLIGLTLNDKPPVKKQNKIKPLVPYVKILFVILLLVVAPAITKRGINWQDHSGYEGIPKDHVRGMAWAIRFGYDNNGFPNFKDVENEIKRIQANTILLVETDTARPFNTNWDIVEYLEENLHMYSDYGPSTMNETWGCALFSYFPIVRADHETLPSPEGENACLIDATLNVGGTLVDVIGVHFGNTEHVLDRELQADDIATRVLAKSKQKRPTLWLGYLTDKVGGPNYNKIIKAGLEDVSPSEKNRYCIYLFHMFTKPQNYKIENVGDITDTDIQIADFYLK